MPILALVFCCKDCPDGKKASLNDEATWHFNVSSPLSLIGYEECHPMLWDALSAEHAQGVHPDGGHCVMGTDKTDSINSIPYMFGISPTCEKVVLGGWNCVRWLQFTHLQWIVVSYIFGVIPYCPYFDSGWRCRGPRLKKKQKVNSI